MSTEWALAYPDSASVFGPVGALQLHWLDPSRGGLPNVTVMPNVREDIDTPLSVRSRLALVVVPLSGPSDEVAEMYGGPLWITVGGESAIVDSRWWIYLKIHRPS